MMVGGAQIVAKPGKVWGKPAGVTARYGLSHPIGFTLPRVGGSAFAGCQSTPVRRNGL